MKIQFPKYERKNMRLVIDVGNGLMDSNLYRWNGYWQ